MITNYKMSIYVALMIALMLLSIFLGLLSGPTPIGYREVISALLYRAGLSSSDVPMNIEAIVWDIRLSRVLLAGIIGCALAVSGCAFQGVLSNPLADPFTIGVASGAAFGATIAISIGDNLMTLPQWLQGIGVIPVFSFIGAMAALSFVIIFSQLSGGVKRDSMILSGIIVATFLSALISLIKALNEESVQAIVFWIMGSLQGRSWIHIGFSIPYIVIGTAMLLSLSKELDIIALGDEQARHIGVETERIRLIILIAASLLTASTVAVVGIIGFIGLIIPHIIRLLIGARHFNLLIGSAILGAITMILSDTLSRIILSGGEEIPVGVITALIGGPVFFIILYKIKIR